MSRCRSRRLSLRVRETVCWHRCGGVASRSTDMLRESGGHVGGVTMHFTSGLIHFYRVNAALVRCNLSSLCRLYGSGTLPYAHTSAAFLVQRCVPIYVIVRFRAEATSSNTKRQSARHGSPTAQGKDTCLYIYICMHMYVSRPLSLSLSLSLCVCVCVCMCVNVITLCYDMWRSSRC
jgi:hypothetical protein